MRILCFLAHTKESDKKDSSGEGEESAIENSHHDPVYDVFWISSKTNSLCASVSTDGQMLFWDTRRLGEPTDRLQVRVRESLRCVYGRRVVPEGREVVWGEEELASVWSSKQTVYSWWIIVRSVALARVFAS